MLIAYGDTLLKCHSEEPVLYPACLLAHHNSSSACRQATKNLAFVQSRRFFVTAVLEKNVQHLRSSE
jgi:hypothetical protein